MKTTMNYIAACKFGEAIQRAIKDIEKDLTAYIDPTKLSAANFDYFTRLSKESREGIGQLREFHTSHEKMRWQIIVEGDAPITAETSDKGEKP